MRDECLQTVKLKSAHVAGVTDDPGDGALQKVALRLSKMQDITLHSAQ